MKEITSIKISRELKDYLAITLGLITYSIGWTVFLLPYKIATGGVSGISAIIFYLTNIEFQIPYFGINLVLLLVALKVLGPKFSLKTIYAIFMITFLLWFFQRILKDENGVLPQILGENQDFMACIIGASLLGLSIGIVFSNNGSTGGTDIIALIVHKYKNIALGRMMMYCDIIIISSCYFMFHDWKRVVFGFVTLIIMTTVVDRVVNSNKQSVQFLIFSRKHDEIAAAITKKINRSVTLLDGSGWYSGESIKVVVLLARKNESIDIFRLVRGLDENAFISQSLVVGAYGEGFDTLKIK
ncbi:MAG: YitT family protein [Phocaeicola sp.]